MADCVFHPAALLLYGAQSFLYELFPGQGGQPDKATISSFFGAVDNGDGTYSHIPERIPPNWRSRVTPYTGVLVNEEILASYLLNPVPFGGNTGQGNFDGLNYLSIKNGQYTPASAADVGCLIQNLLLAPIPSTLDGIQIPVANLLAMATKLNPIFSNIAGCPAITPS